MTESTPTGCGRCYPLERCYCRKPSGELPAGSRVRINGITVERRGGGERPWVARRFGRFTDDEVDRWRQEETALLVRVGQLGTPRWVTEKWDGTTITTPWQAHDSNEEQR